MFLAVSLVVRFGLFRGFLPVRSRLLHLSRVSHAIYFRLALAWVCHHKNGSARLCLQSVALLHSYWYVSLKKV